MTPQAAVLLGVLALIWGTSFVANRAALTQVPVLTVVALRVTIAAALMWVWVLARGQVLPRGLRAWRGFAVMGFFNSALPFTLIVWGQNHIDSGLAAILNASTAIFGVVVASMVFADERLTPRRVVGVTVGFAGVVLAIGPEALAHLDLTSLAQLAVLAASVSYAIAGSYSRVRIRGLAPEVAAAGMLTCASLWVLPAALLRDGMPTLAWSAETWAGMLFLAVIASAVAYILNYRILALAGAGNLSLVTLLLTPVAIVLGWVVYDEALGWRALAGFGLLAMGLLVLNTRIGARFLAEKQ